MIANPQDRRKQKTLRPLVITRGFCSLMALLIGAQACTSLPDQGPRPGESPDELLVDLASIHWIHGAQDCDAARIDPEYTEWQQVRYQVDTYIFRQNKCSNYEAPFVYLLIGTDRALLIDTGATIESGASLLGAVRDITDAPLIVAHSHGHGDHTQGDGAFSSADNAVVVGLGADAEQEFFGFENWPNDPTQLELGDRRIELLPIPGHEDDHIAFYDPTSQFAITGDTLYPGRLYVGDWDDFCASIARLNEWIQNKPVAYVMGTHIEMTAAPDVDYPMGTTYQPNERYLPLSTADITALHETLVTMEVPKRTYLGSFIVWPLQ